MDFDDLTRHYFGTDTLDTLTAPAFEAGVERLRVDLGLERDGTRRFALWALLYMLEAAPDLDVAFKDPADREAALDFMDMIDAQSPDGS